MDSLERKQYVTDYFVKKWYTEVSSIFQWSPKSLIHIFSTEVKSAIARGNNLEDQFWPDFTLVKRGEVIVKWLQLVRIKEQTRFSLWRIINDGEKFPFSPVRKNGNIIRIPEFKKNIDYWEVMNKLLIRE